MYPVFYEFDAPLIGRVSFPAYMTMLMVGFFVAILLARREGARVGIPAHHIVDLGLICVVAGIFGARILAVLTDGKFMDFVHLCTDPRLVEAIDRKVNVCTADAQCGYDYLCDTARNVCYPPRDCLAALKFWQGGLTYYGGFLTAVPAGLWYARRKQIHLMRVLDVAAPVTMVGLFFGRWGCFFNGCCYGGPTDAWVGVHMPGHAGTVHPTQLYEAALVLLLAVVLHVVVRPRKRGDGEVFGWLLVSYGIIRFALELFRDDARGALGPLSTSQLISIPLVIAGAWVIRRAIHSARSATAE